MASGKTIKTPNGLTWYYQQEGQGPHIVLVPSGEGDCSSFDTASSILCKSFTVTTFDMPGMSRSVPVPAEAVARVTAELLASQIISIIDALDIKEATFYGCSSGAAAVLALQALYPERVRNAIVHECPLVSSQTHFEVMVDMLDHSPEQAVEIGIQGLASMIEDKTAAENLSAEYKARLRKNMPLWIRGYIPVLPPSITELVKVDANLLKKPIDWTVGGLNRTNLFFENIVIATRLGIPISLLDTQHFPQIAKPEMLAEHIEKTTMKYL